MNGAFSYCLKGTERMSKLSRNGLVQSGFTGFCSVASLRGQGTLGIPRVGGVYVVLRTGEEPDFRATSSGGRFKGKNPSVAVDALHRKWVDSADVLYIGQSNDLRRRLLTLVQFGDGRPVGHWGGRYLWQLANSGNLTVAWLPAVAPRAAEAELLSTFKEEYGGRLPFANLL